MANFKVEQILSHQESDIIVCPTLDNAPSVLPETKCFKIFRDFGKAKKLARKINFRIIFLYDVCTIF